MIKSLISLFCLLPVLCFGQKEGKIELSEWVLAPSVAQTQKPLIFLDFWATWCKPCLTSMTYTKTLESTFEDDVLFVYLSDEPAHKVSRFMEEKNLHFISALDQERISINRFDIQILPQAILMGPEGQVIWKGKPTDLSAQDLQSFVQHYATKKGNKDRFVLNQKIEEELVWNNFQHQPSSLFYAIDEHVSSQYSFEAGDYSFSGPVETLISLVYGVADYQIKPTQKDQYLRIKSDAQSAFEFNNLVDQFLRKHYQMHSKTQKHLIYELHLKNDENLLDAQVYDFEKGNNAYLVDESSVLIDNADLQAMTGILSSFSDYDFTYKGQNKKLYDWNIYVGDAQNMWLQLKEEFQFTVKEKEVVIDFYYLEPFAISPK